MSAVRKFPIPTEENLNELKCDVQQSVLDQSIVCI